MRYCTREDLLLAMPHDTLVQLSQDDPCSTVIDATVIARCIDRAQELIDGHLRVRYVTPLNPAPTLVNTIATTLVQHMLYARRPDGREMPPAVHDLYRAQLRLLEQIGKGEVSLGVPTHDTTYPSPSKMRVRAPARVFTFDAEGKPCR